jgi:uncharacterized protein
VANSVALPQLHRRFKPLPVYRHPEREYSLLPFRFIALDSQRTLLVNMIGEWLADLDRVVDGTLRADEPLFDDLVAKHFIALGEYQSALDLLANGVRARYEPLSQFTSLHLFVVTLRCDHSCPYCQVSRVSEDKQAYDMSAETAERAVKLVFRSPSQDIKIEFQGGEPLLNFDRIRQVVELAERINVTRQRRLQFVIATTLAQLKPEMLEYCRQHQIFISTSLDGPAWLHNANRPRPGKDSHQLTLAGIEAAREKLGRDRVAALMTTTLRSLEHVEEIVDQYIALGFEAIFLRPLSPYGFAAKSGKAIGYPIEQWNAFYERGLRAVLASNKRGVPIREEYAAIVLRKMLTPYPTRYVDLQSPAGMVLGAAVYNYDGDVYASDESRMLAENQDHTFRLGNVHRDTYESIFLSERLQAMLADTMTDAIPVCEQCAFEPFCGTDPTFHQATQGDMVGHRPSSAFCQRNMFVFRLLLRMLLDEVENADILMGWA